MWIIGYHNVQPRVKAGTYELEKQKAIQAVSKLSPEEIKKISFWGGTPDTENPEGIWQNIFYKEVQDKNLSSFDYPKSQKILA